MSLSNCTGVTQAGHWHAGTGTTAARALVENEGPGGCVTVGWVAGRSLRFRARLDVAIVVLGIPAHPKEQNEENVVVEAGEAAGDLAQERHGV